jgi:hypothetical protein
MAGLMALPRSELRAAAIVFLATGGVPALFETRFADSLADPLADPLVAPTGRLTLDVDPPSTAI